MTSRNSFWADSRENHKRRIWVWILSVLAQLAAYVGVLTVYLSRIRTWNAEGAYRTLEDYQNALYQAAKDALGFSDNLLIIQTGLAVMIGVQGFSYLYDRRKVDLYHSVPVNRNRRFAVIYVNGIIIYLAATLSGLLIGTVTAAVQGAVNGDVMAAVGLGFVWNLLYFLVMYHTALLAVMITGNRLITLCIAGALAVYELMVYDCIENMQYVFFRTVSRFYVSHDPKLSAVYDYFARVWDLKHAANVKEIAGEVLPYYGKWFILAVILLAAAWFCYRRRPSEAAGKAVAFPRLEPVIKVAAVIPVSIGLGIWVYSAAGGSTMLMAAGMAISGVIACAVIEVIYDFDIRSLFKHPVSGVVAVAGIAVVFLIFWKDLFGYDTYVPEAGDLDSIAVCVDYYGQFWDEDFTYRSTSDFSEEHMRLKDVEPVLELAARAQQKDVKEMDDPRMLYVLYRLKSGRRVGRCFPIDFADPDNGKLMNRIMGTQEFKEGTFQIMTDADSYSQAMALTYSNGAVKIALPAEDGQELREAYVKDMEQFDFSLATSKRPCGRITVRFPNWMETDLDVYEGFGNTIAYLTSRDAYYPVQLNPEDIADITVTNFHNELSVSEDYNAARSLYRGAADATAIAVDYAYQEGAVVSETFYEPEELAQIAQVIYPTYLSTAWNNYRELDDNYDVYITFKKDTDYPYDRGSYGVYYRFYTGQAPEFVVEATAADARSE